MSNKVKKKCIYIRCNSAVKKYTVEHLNQIGIDVGLAQLYQNLVTDGYVISKFGINASKLADQLITLMPNIRPPFPIETAFSNEMSQLITKWEEEVRTLTKELKCRPVYFKEAVDKLLATKSSVRCSRKHLEWCLSILGADNMTPAKIADTILKYEKDAWEKVSPFGENDYYYIRLDDNSEEVHKDFHERIEFIYNLSPSSVDGSLVKKLEDDVRLMLEIKKRRNKGVLNLRSSVVEFLEDIKSLQTVSSSILPKKLIRKLEGIVSSDRKE